jgi:predicted CoA-binding protein
MQKKTIVLGASANPARYSYLAVQRLHAHHHPITAIGNKPGNIDDVAITTAHPDEKNVDTVTMYLGKQNQPQYYDYILSLHPKRIIFNPGAENEELEQLAKQNGIEPMRACTLVLLSTGQF